jgi:hypothetical protein
VALLPKVRAVTTARAATITAGHERRIGHLLVWLCFAILISFLSPHQNVTTTGAAALAPTSKATPPTEGSGAKPASSGASSRADVGDSPLPVVPSAGLTR